MIAVIKNFQEVIETKDISRMTKELYEFLILHCGFIAHYDIHGFYSEYFEAGQDIAVEYWFCFDGLKTKRAVCMAKRLHALCNFILQTKRCIQTWNCGNGFGDRTSAFQPGSHTVIRQFGLTAHLRRVDIMVDQKAILLDDHLNNNSQAVFVKIKRAKIG